MDVQTSLICLALFVLSAALVFIVSFFGVKEKTYEEAIAEQRRRNDDRLLLGQKGDKSKKQKKSGKKVKEKTVTPSHVDKNSADIDDKESSAEPRPVTPPTPSIVVEEDKPAHVEFEQPVAEVESETRKKRKKDKIKPILLNKDEQSPTVEADPPASNDFEHIQPKDDLLLKRRQSVTNKEEAAKNVEAAAVVAEEPIVATVFPETEARVVRLATPEPEQQPAVVAPLQQQAPPPKETQQQPKRKKKNELSALQHIGASAEAIPISLLVSLLQKAEMSHSEMQNLIDVLLNKQQGAATGDSEWTTGAQDPIVKLKKQLAEKEEALKSEKEASNGHQQRLRDLRAEFNSEKSRLMQAVRSSEEVLTSKTQEVTALTGRLQQVQDSTSTERQNLQSQIQQLQQKLNEERMTVRQLQEDKTQQQSAVQQEIISHRHQLEIHIHRLEEQRKEEEASFQVQLGQLQASLKEKDNQLQASLKEKDNQVNSIGSQLQSALEVRDKLEKELERLSQQAVAASAEAKQLSDESLKTRSELDSRTREMSSAANEIRTMKLDINRLQEENEFLAAQLAAVTERPAAEGREMNGDNDAATIEKLAQQEKEYQDILQQKEAILSQLTAEVGQYKTELNKTKEELEIQRRLTSDLQQKNLAVMDALETFELTLASKMVEYETLVSESINKVKAEDQESTRKLLQRIFPAITVEECKEHNVWLSSFEAKVEQYLTELSRPKTPTPTPVPIQSEDPSQKGVLEDMERQNKKLQGMVTHYKSIIEDTEGMLNKLESHVESEERRWRHQLEEKQMELDRVMEEQEKLHQSLEQVRAAEEMQEKLRELQRKLQEEENEKKDLAQKCEVANKSCSDLREQLDRTQEKLNSSDRLQQEVGSLTNRLKEENEKGKDLLTEVTKLRSLVTIGQDALKQEQHEVQQLSDELQSLRQQQNTTATQNHHNSECGSPATAATNGPSSTETVVPEGGFGKK